MNLTKSPWLQVGGLSFAGSSVPTSSHFTKGTFLPFRASVCLAIKWENLILYKKILFYRIHWSTAVDTIKSQTFVSYPCWSDLSFSLWQSIATRNHWYIISIRYKRYPSLSHEAIYKYAVFHFSLFGKHQLVYCVPLLCQAWLSKWFSTGWYCEGYRLLSPESRRLSVKSLPLPPPSAPVSVPSHLAIYQKIDRKQTSMPPAHVHSKSNRYWGHHFNFPWAIIYCPLPSHHCSSFLFLRRPSALKSFLFLQHLRHARLLCTDYLWVFLERKKWQKIPALRRFKILVFLKCLHIS